MLGDKFMQKGYRVVDFKDTADIYVFNTCTVTENAEKECRQFVRRALRNNPAAFVVVTGCYAQLRPDEIASIEGVDAILGSHEKLKLFDLIDSFNKKELACIFVSPTKDLNEFGPAHSTDADSRTRAYLKIQDGCDYKCSFCTIPLARGLSRSMAPGNAVDDFKKLIDTGYKEIILTGVNVGDYGKSFNINLYNLLLKFVSLPGDYRIRISSIEPNLLSDEIIELTASSDKMCKHFHIPLQSGSELILKKMRRRYDAELYRQKIYKINEMIPEAGIGVDVITGFPGESEDHFLETYNFIKELPVSYLHVFTYSERPDTNAVTLTDTVPHQERKRRTNLLRSLSELKKNAFYSSFKGKAVDVLFEENQTGNAVRGFSSNYIRVEHQFINSITNKILPVEIESTGDGICYGKILEKDKSIDLLAG
jgi:threonylcarbamoyladenosine tRNA methylthiotransferase MtaB